MAVIGDLLPYWQTSAGNAELLSLTALHETSLVPDMRQPEQGDGMRSLYEVFIIDPEATDHDEQICFVDQFVATSEANARAKAWLAAMEGAAEKEVSRDPDDFDFIVRNLGPVRAKKGDK